MILAIGSVDDRVRARLSSHGDVVEVDPDDREAIDRRLPDAVGIVARATARSSHRPWWPAWTLTRR